MMVVVEDSLIHGTESATCVARELFVVVAAFEADVWLVWDIVSEVVFCGVFESFE